MTKSDYDRRLTPARGDLAAEHLIGEVEADRYVEGETWQVIAGAAAIRRAPAPDAGQETQMLFGETFTAYEVADGWAWGQARLDDYVGYVAVEALAPGPAIPPTHRVTALRTFRYAEPDLKSAVLGALPMNAKLQAGTGAGDKYVREARGGWVAAQHLAPLADKAPDPAGIAQLFLNVPYLWGGRDSAGLDCSGLVQNALERAGTMIPRDTDMQEAWCADHAKALFVRKKERDDWSGLVLARNDLLFWKGHVAMMIDATRMIHANATAMAVSVDEARGFAGNVSAEAGPVQAIYRLG